MLLHAEECQLVLVDYQIRLMPAIADGPSVLANAVRLTQLARAMEVPAWATEQNPSKLGASAEPLNTVLAESRARICPDRDDPPDVLGHCIGKCRARVAAEHVHRAGLAQVEVARMHLGGDRAGDGACIPVPGPELRLRVPVRDRLDDGEGIPHDQVTDAQSGHLA